MKNFIFFIIFIIINFNCNNKKDFNNVNLRINDSIDVELLYLKNHLFMLYLNQLENNIYSDYGIIKEDSCFKKKFVLDVSIHQNVQTKRYDLKYIYFDNNSKRLLKKWNDKDDFELIPYENGNKIKHKFNYYKALEFYNSQDLKKYIDSVRIIEYEKLNKEK